MALQKDITSSSGIVVTDAYIKIDEYSCTKTNEINARIRAYVSKEFEGEGKSPIEGTEDIITFKADYSDEAMNTKKQVYNHMKTLDFYKDAIDVLE